MTAISMFQAAVYSAIEAVADGKIGEMEIERRFTDESANSEEVITVIVRREHRPPFVMENPDDR